MSPHKARGCARSLTGARGARVAHGARGDRDEGDNDNHHESVMGGGAHAFGGNVWVVGVVRNTVQEMLVPARAADTRVTIREGVNETRRITHPKSQCEGTSEQSEGHFSKKPKSSMLLDQTSRRGPIYLVVTNLDIVLRAATEGSEKAVKTGSEGSKEAAGYFVKITD
ncbi:hypothetical protein Acr_21g0005800 [Actinidia rufa]|uniref:Uncharacterized protein n=1 Tax=Actinidia rufa TaxID=165716 RepID=A0A7J0GGY0_9ERIC|nr:hypothetical protein Acr_21g0005800 [Actinidia rufa]